MAKHVGKSGVVKVGANDVANMKSWSFSEDSAQIDTTVMNDTFGSQMAGLPSGSGSFTTLWDPSDTTGQGALTNGASVTLNMYPDGEASNDYYYTCTAVVTNISVTSSHDSSIDRAYTWVASTAITETQVP